MAVEGGVAESQNMTLKERYEATLNYFATKKETCMAIRIGIDIEKVSGGFSVTVGRRVMSIETQDGGGYDGATVKHGVATTPHQATVQARKLVKELLEQIEQTMGKETA